MEAAKAAQAKQAVVNGMLDDWLWLTKTCVILLAAPLHAILYNIYEIGVNLTPFIPVVKPAIIYLPERYRLHKNPDTIRVCGRNDTVFAAFLDGEPGNNWILCGEIY
jgi:hypothetical protein